jgi:signal transduction histidine kinase
LAQEAIPSQRWFRRRARRPRPDPLAVIERTEERLWLLALLIIFLLAVGLYLLGASDDVTLTAERPYLRPLVLTLGSDVTTSLLLLVVLLICGYFHERVTARRRENRRLIESLRANQEALEKRNRQLTTWGELSHALIANFDLPRLLDLIVATAVEVTGCDSGSVMLVDEQGRLRIEAARGLPEEVIEQTRLAPGLGFAGRVLETGQPVLLRHSDARPELRAEMHRDPELASAISVPLKSGDRVAGVLNVCERGRRSEELGEDDLRSLCIFADQASLALEKARLYRDSQLQLERLLRVLDELGRTQTQLLHSEKLASVGVLAGGVAHEINNPLMVVLGRTELALQRPDLPPEMRRNLETIKGETERISEIVRGLLAFSRRSQHDAVEPVDVSEVLERTLALTEHQMRTENIQVVREFAPDLPRIEANAGQLQQVFMNLIINAFQAMSGGGTLRLTTRPGSERTVVVEVTDTGSGIPPDQLPHIFDPFFTTKEESKGTGLGLAITHHIVTDHGGEIEVRSEVGQGTQFTVELPLKRPAAKLEDAVAAAPASG